MQSYINKAKAFFFDSYYSKVKRYVISQIGDEKDIEDKEQRRRMRVFIDSEVNKIYDGLRKNGFEEQDLKPLLFDAKIDIDSLKILFSYCQKAKTVGLEYFKKEYLIKAVKVGISIPVYYQLALIFQHMGITEESDFANFSKLFEYPGINDETLLELVYVLSEAKARDFPIKQDDLMRFYYANPPHSTDLKALFQALLASKENDLNLTLEDFIKGVISGRSPRIFLATWQKIVENQLPISKMFYISLSLDPKKIYKIINLMATAKKYGQYIEFDKIYKQLMSGLKPDGILKVLIKMLESGFEVDYDYISKLAANRVDLATIVPAFELARSKGFDIKNFIADINRLLLLKKTKEEAEASNEYFNLLNFTKAIVAASEVYGIDKEIILNDYISGLDAWSILDLITYAKKQGVDISYPLAKALDKTEEGLKTIVAKSLNPFEIDVHGVRVTTKDNIEILANIDVFVTYNPANYFKGSGEDILIRRIKAIFIDEVQKKYNHDEIIENIELLSRNILLRLMGKKPIQSPIEKVKLEEASKEIEEEQMEDRFSNVSKFKPVRILIPRIEFVQETFKDFEKVKHEYELHHKLAEAELEKLRAEIKIKEAWAESKDLRYLILKDEERHEENRIHPLRNSDDEDEH